MTRMSSIPRACSSRPIMAASCRPSCSVSIIGAADRAGHLSVLSRLDVPQLRLKARAGLGLEPAHILDPGAGDVDAPSGPSENESGPSGYNRRVVSDGLPLAA